MRHGEAGSGAGEASARLAWGDRVYRAHAPESGAAAESPVVRLLRGVHELLPPEEALRAVRGRIFTSLEPTPACRGAVKVSGKRLTWSGGARVEGERLEARSSSGDAGPGSIVEAPAAGAIVDVGPASDAAQARAEAALGAAVAALSGDPGAAEDPEGALEAALASPDAPLASLVQALAARVPREEARFRSDRPVAAILVDREGRVLSAGVNAVARNRCLHAEASLVRRLARRTGQGIPGGALLVASLTPCKMCAGIIWCASSEPASLRVRFIDADPGRAARGTVLERGSNERRAAARSREEAGAEVLARVPRGSPLPG